MSYANVLLVLCVLFAIACSVPEQTSPRDKIEANTSTRALEHLINTELIFGIAIGDTVVDEGTHVRTIDDLSFGALSTRAAIKSRSRAGRVEEIILEIDITDPEDLLYCMEQLRSHLDELYHPSKGSSSYVSWKSPSRSGSLVEIELYDARVAYQREQIHLRWKERRDKKYGD